MFSQNVVGDGGCLFTSLGVALRTHRLLDLSQEDLKNLPEFEEHPLNGMSRQSVCGGFQLRLGVVQWYMNNLEQDVPLLGKIIEKDKDTWKAKDILNLELARYQDMTDSKEQVLKYLYHMTNFTSWGSTPEYIAFSLIVGVPVRVWRREEMEIVLNDTFPHDLKLEDKAINILFVHGNHYEPLITSEQKDQLELIRKDFGKYYYKKYVLKL